MGLTAVLTVRPKAGRHQEARQGLEELKEVVEQQGQSSRLIRPVTGDAQGELSLVTVYDDWAEFGAAAGKLQASSGYQQILERARKNSDTPIDSMSTNFYVDV